MEGLAKQYLEKNKGKDASATAHDLHAMLSRNVTATNFYVSVHIEKAEVYSQAKGSVQTSQCRSIAAISSILTRSS